MKNKKRGFTLIELMVVMSVISVVASTVLVALGTAKTKARNALVVQETLDLRNQIEQS